MERLDLDSKKREREIIHKLEKSLALLNSRKSVHEFLPLLFSPTEKERLAKRLEIIKRLRRGVSYREIKKELEVSDNTIAQMSNALKEASPQALITVDRLLAEDLKENGTGLRFTTGLKTS